MYALRLLDSDAFISRIEPANLHEMRPLVFVRYMKITLQNKVVSHHIFLTSWQEMKVRSSFCIGCISSYLIVSYK